MRDALLQVVLLFVVSLAAGQTNTPAWRDGSHEKICGLGTYHDSLDLAFKNATKTSGETLLMVEALPSFQRESALDLKRADSEVNLARARFQTQLWYQLAPLQASRTRKCLGLASAVTLDTVTFPINPETATSLLSGFGNIRLIETDDCPRKGLRALGVRSLFYPGYPGRQIDTYRKI